MRKTILSYILTCIEECSDEELYHQIIELEETITKVLLEEEDDFLEYIIVMIYTADKTILPIKLRKLYSHIVQLVEE
jgi:hypothetical protein